MSPLNPKLTRFVKIKNTGLTRSFEAFSSSLAQSAGEVWLKRLGKIPAPKFWLIWNQKGKILRDNLSPCCVANASCFNKMKVLFVIFLQNGKLLLLFPWDQASLSSSSFWLFLCVIIIACVPRCSPSKISQLTLRQPARAQLMWSQVCTMQHALKEHM